MNDPISSEMRGELSSRMLADLPKLREAWAVEESTLTGFEQLCQGIFALGYAAGISDAIAPGGVDSPLIAAAERVAGLG